MSLDRKDLQGEFRFFRKSKLIFSKGKCFDFHFPLQLASLLGLQKGHHVNVFVNLPSGVIVLKVIRDNKK